MNLHHERVFGWIRTLLTLTSLTLPITVVTLALTRGIHTIPISSPDSFPCPPGTKPDLLGYYTKSPYTNYSLPYYLFHLTVMAATISVEVLQFLKPKVSFLTTLK